MTEKEMLTMDKAKENRTLNEEQLDQATGGTGPHLPPQRFNVGDRVQLLVYPKYGVGKVTAVNITGSSWTCTAKFDAGVVTADESEFITA